MKILNAYSKSVRRPHRKCGKSLTEQHHEKACNINNIMARYNKTGLIDHVNRHQGTYGDATGADFEAAQNLIAEQKTIFHELPASVRDQLDNDPQVYLDLVMDEEGQETLRNLLTPQGTPGTRDPEIVEKEPQGASDDAPEAGEQQDLAVT